MSIVSRINSPFIHHMQLSLSVHNFCQLILNTCMAWLRSLMVCSLTSVWQAPSPSDGCQ